MSEVLRVDLTALLDAVPALSALSSTVDMVRERLVTALDSEGACWGGDATGQAFAQGYLEADAQIHGAFSELSRAMRDVAGSLRLVVDNVDAAEVRATTRFN